MIDRQLPPIAPDITIRPDDQQEAFAFCYLAAYNDVAIEPRVFQSFQRAYGCDAIFQTAYVPDGRPGFCIAQWNQPTYKKVVVAIEGARSQAQLRTLSAGYVGQSSLAGHDGKCWGTAYTYASQIRTLLMADTNFTSMLALTPCPIIFTGYSLGAAVAEILGEMFAISHPLKGRRVIKFASPRVGNPAWVAGKSRTTVRSSVYCGRDPIDIYPSFMPVSTLHASAFPNTYVCYANDGAADRFEVLGDPVQPFYEGGGGEVIRYGRAWRAALNTLNPWFDHQRGMYRMMFCNITSPWSSLSRYRFIYLEFADENSWGVAYRPGPTPTVQMEYLNPVQPNPVEVDIADSFIRAAREAVSDADTQGIEGGGWDFDQEPAPALMQQIPEPVQPAMRDVMRPVSVTFYPQAQGRRRR